MKANRSIAVLGSALLVTAAFAQTKTNSFPDSGNVGIGTQTPRACLELVSSSPTATANLMVTSGQDRTPRIRFNGPWSISNANESYAQIVAVNDNGGPGSSAASLHFFTSSGDPAVLSDKVVITGSGNIGVGTTTPREKLQVIGNLRVQNVPESAAGTNCASLSSGATPQVILTRSNSTWWDSWWEWTMGTDNKLRLGYSSVAQLTFSNGLMGIGTDSPLNRLHIADDVRISRATGTWGPNLLLDGTRVGSGGSVWAITSSTASDVGGAGRLAFVNSSSAKFVLDPSGNVGIGTTNPMNKLEVNGTVRAREVVVETTGWSDYVFAPDYRLMPLPEVRAYIATEGRLPGLPSATEVANTGVSVGEMQAKLLAKVEELTLHMIALSEKIGALEAENAALKAAR